MTKKLKSEIEESAKKIFEYIYSKITVKPDLCVITGSGIGEALSDFKIIDAVKYDEIPGFPKATVEGHRNEFLTIDVGGAIIGAFGGRFHLYEGKSVAEVALPVLLASICGAGRIVATNSSGGLNPKFSTGDIVIIEDIQNYTNKNPNEIFVGDGDLLQCESLNLKSRFVDSIRERLDDDKIAYGRGVYASVLGPSYETPAEIRMYRRLGADCIGMSTFIECAAAASLGMEVAACSIITNVLSDVDTKELTHEEVIEAASKAKNKVASFILAAASCK